MIKKKKPSLQCLRDTESDFIMHEENMNRGGKKKNQTVSDNNDHAIYM